jgi:hypothetical protein
MLVAYDPADTLLKARTRYFEVNGFGDGGYDLAWVPFKLGPIPMPFPNTAGRVKAVRYHDLHHVLTGYDTTTLGEFEISAWELASGCTAMPAAWFLNTNGMVAGLFVSPSRVLQAYARGRRSRNLYDQAFGDALLSRTVGEQRTACGLDGPGPAPTAEDRRAFAGAVARAVPVCLATAAVMLAPPAVVAYGLFRLLG